MAQRQTRKPQTNFTQTIRSAWQKTTSPLRGATLPPAISRIPFAKNLTFGAAALLIFLIVGALAIFFFGNQIVLAWQERTAAAVVNGEVIPKSSLERRLLQSYGDTLVQNLVDETLITQEGRKQKITVASSDIDAKIKEIEKQISPTKLSDALSSRKLSMADLQRQIEVQIIAEKILIKDISIKDQDITDYFDKNKDSLATNAGKKPEELKLDDVRETIISQLQSQQVSAKYRPWIEDLRSKSQIKTFVNP